MTTVRPLTILMPIYNGIEFIDEALDSIQSQTYRDWYLIIGINGHPARSPVYETALRAVERAGIPPDTAFVMDLPEVRGKSAALNQMMKCVLSPHIALLDVDDVWLPEKLAQQMPQTDLYSVVGSQCVYFGRNDNPCVGIIPFIPLGEFDQSRWDFLKTNPVINSSAIIRRELCEWIPEWDGVEDYELWIRLAKQQHRFFNVPAVLVKHRLHSQSAFNSLGAEEQHRKVVELWNQHRNHKID